MDGRRSVRFKTAQQQRLGFYNKQWTEALCDGRSSSDGVTHTWTPHVAVLLLLAGVPDTKPPSSLFQQRVEAIIRPMFICSLLFYEFDHLQTCQTIHTHAHEHTQTHRLADFNSLGQISCFFSCSCPVRLVCTSSCLCLFTSLRQNKLSLPAFLHLQRERLQRWRFTVDFLFRIVGLIKLTKPNSRVKRQGWASPERWGPPGNRRRLNRPALCCTWSRGCFEKQRRVGPLDSAAPRRSERCWFPLLHIKMRWISCVSSCP